MKSKFISRDTLRKRKARENELPSKCEKCLGKQHVYEQRRREASGTRDKKKRVKLSVETDEQRKKRLCSYQEQRVYLKDIQDKMNLDLNSRQTSVAKIPG